MDDLIWIVVAVIGVIVSLASKVAKQQQERQAGRSQEAPKWPGPVAGPRPGQGPTWAPAPGPRPTLAPVAKPQPAAAPAKREAARTLVSGDVFTRSLDMEGYGSEGAGSEGQGVEGPDPGEGVEEELSRFSRESEQMERRQLSRLTDDLVRPEDAAAVVTAYEGTSAELQASLGDMQSVARAIVLAEVLGKPKALRGRGRRM